VSPPADADATALGAALAIAEQAADKTAAIALSGLGRVHQLGHKQGPSDLVTEFDLAVERAVLAHLRAAFPADTMVGEEGTTDASGRENGRAWYIDPIDGTTNFAHGLPFFALSIGLCDERGPALGLIDAPALGWRFTAVRGGGAFLSTRGVARSLAVSRTARLAEALLATGFPYDLRTSPEDNLAEFAHLQRAGQAVRRVGAASLDLAMVAAGWFDGYWEQKLKPWDLAAGVVLVTEAGGRVSGYDGGAVDLRSGRLVASNGAIHDELIAALAASPK
jgi:myo-inositol-1(or 4)-monophosphatase